MKGPPVPDHEKAIEITRLLSEGRKRAVLDGMDTRSRGDNQESAKQVSKVARATDTHGEGVSESEEVKAEDRDAEQ